jgi:hypothetical protein
MALQPQQPIALAPPQRKPTWLAAGSARVHFQNIKQLSFRKSLRQKSVTILLAKSFRFEKGEPPMRIKHAIFAGSVAALASMAAPALAKHSDAQKTSEQTTSSPCIARQQTADGTWTQLPCQELGAPQQTPRQSATRSSDQQMR